MVTRKPVPDGQGNMSSSSDPWSTVDDIPSSWESVGSMRQASQAMQNIPNRRSPPGHSAHGSDSWDPSMASIPIQQPQPLQPTYTGTNPFLRQQNSLSNMQAPAPPVDAPVPPLPDHNALAQLSLQENSNNPWQPALDRAGSSSQIGRAHV